MHTKLKIIGCGGHSKVVIDALSTNLTPYEITLCDDNPRLLGTEFLGFLIDSNLKEISSFSGYVHVAIGNNEIRKRLFASFPATLKPLTITHSAAIVSKSARVMDGVFIAARAILAPECSVGVGSIINHGAVVDHEVKIGPFTHIAPNSTLGGGVAVGEGVLVGAGAVVLPNVIIGDKAVIGAGAVVVNNVNSGSVVKGIPAA
ncbi:NeuD/PglB/VioB family sugar acetyltransferase [Legionella sp. km772]|uniref:NeuD/PglB/VioB family sugar acetyltransferase n=1 Tax=Legionella sp. km772 TaxID=2498111 RepID=UPI000F8D80EA|nr:NeuD/PglB/VioB family sugar acetyltransferase [Legionella sp. km772]RUR12117.1 acetyltransferase [Legionella sp. km772]